MQLVVKFPMMRLILIGIFILQTTRAFALSCPHFFMPNNENFSSEQWHQEYVKLRESLKSGEDIIQKLSLKSEDIAAIKELIGNFGDTGGTPGGVFLVETSTGKKLLKLSYKNWHELITNDSGMTNLQRDEVIIQNHFAGLGLAVPVRGILKAEEVKNLMNRFPEMQSWIRHYSSFSKAEWTGYLMDYIPGAYNPKKRGSSFEISPPPEHAASWNIEKIYQRVKQIAVARENLKLHLKDPQILISREGQVFAIDFAYETVLDRADNSGKGFRPPTYVTGTENSYKNLIDLIKRFLDSKK